MMKVLRVHSDHKDFRELVRWLDNDLNSRYGIVQAQYDKLNKIEALDTVVIGYIGDKAVGCGCFKTVDKDSVEIKRMFVSSEARSSGIAKMVLQELEKWAIEKGFSAAVLETGIKQPEAIRFYTKLGYTLIDNYGPYIGNLNSVCMKKEFNKLS